MKLSNFGSINWWKNWEMKGCCIASEISFPALRTVIIIIPVCENGTLIGSPIVFLKNGRPLIMTHVCKNGSLSFCIVY